MKKNLPNKLIVFLMLTIPTVTLAATSSKSTSTLRQIMDDIGSSTMSSSTMSSTSTSTATITTLTINPYAPVIATDTIRRLEVNNNDIPIVSSDQVRTEDDLSIFNKNQSIINPNVSKVTEDTDRNGNTSITVNYKYPGKLLGILPVSYKTINTVSTEGGDATTSNATGTLPVANAKLSFWSHIVSDKSFDESNIESRFENNPVIRNSLEANASPGEQARVAEAMIYELNKNGQEATSSSTSQY